MVAERDHARRLKAQEIREKVAKIAFERAHPQCINNGEEGMYGYLANFHKGLLHNRFGEVQHSAYRALLHALTTGDPNDFENIPLGGGRKFVNPQAGLAFDLEGPDAQSLTIPAAPRIDGPENSSEMGELYWMALLRDTHFSHYKAGAELVGAAVASLNNDFSDFRGPKEDGKVTPQTLFRGIAVSLCSEQPLHGFAHATRLWNLWWATSSIACYGSRHARVEGGLAHEMVCASSATPRSVRRLAACPPQQRFSEQVLRHD